MKKKKRQVCGDRQRTDQYLDQIEKLAEVASNWLVYCPVYCKIFNSFIVLGITIPKVKQN